MTEQLIKTAIENNRKDKKCFFVFVDAVVFIKVYKFLSVSNYIKIKVYHRLLCEKTILFCLFCLSAYFIYKDCLLDKNKLYKD